MIEQIETQLETVDSSIGDKMHVLDRDASGTISRTLRHRQVPDAKVDELVRKLMRQMDQNDDGVLTTDELNAWIEERVDQSEVGVHQETEITAMCAAGGAAAERAAASAAPAPAREGAK